MAGPVSQKLFLKKYFHHSDSPLQVLYTPPSSQAPWKLTFVVLPYTARVNSSFDLVGVQKALYDYVSREFQCGVSQLGEC